MKISFNACNKSFMVFAEELSFCVEACCQFSDRNSVIIPLTFTSSLCRPSRLAQAESIGLSQFFPEHAYSPTHAHDLDPHKCLFFFFLLKPPMVILFNSFTLEVFSWDCGLSQLSPPQAAATLNNFCSLFLTLRTSGLHGRSFKADEIKTTLVNRNF